MADNTTPGQPPDATQHAPTLDDAVQAASWIIAHPIAAYDAMTVHQFNMGMKDGEPHAVVHDTIPTPAGDYTVHTALQGLDNLSHSEYMTNDHGVSGIGAYIKDVDVNSYVGIDYTGATQHDPAADHSGFGLSGSATVGAWAASTGPDGHTDVGSIGGTLNSGFDVAPIAAGGSSAHATFTDQHGEMHGGWIGGADHATPGIDVPSMNVPSIAIASIPLHEIHTESLTAPVMSVPSVPVHEIQTDSVSTSSIFAHHSMDSYDSFAGHPDHSTSVSHDDAGHGSVSVDPGAGF